MGEIKFKAKSYEFIREKKNEIMDQKKNKRNDIFQSVRVVIPVVVTKKSSKENKIKCVDVRLNNEKVKFLLDAGSD